LLFSLIVVIAAGEFPEYREYMRLTVSLQVLLSLGASVDYKDRRGLTPLYHTVLTGGDTSCCETLLYHHAKLGIRDENGWDETHQVPAHYLAS